MEITTKPWYGVYLELKENQDIVSKYTGAGIYSITIGDKLVYIGKSKDMLGRLAQHIFYINNPQFHTSHKYRILHQAKEQNYEITFDKLYSAVGTSEKQIEDEIGNKEGELIREKLPYLNYQIPKVENYHTFFVNKQAKTITLQEIMGKSE